MKKNKKIPLTVLRQSRRLSQRELASKVGLSSGTIAQYETGNRAPSLENALKIANFFSMSVEQIKFNCKDG